MGGGSVSDRQPIKVVSLLPRSQGPIRPVLFLTSSGHRDEERAAESFTVGMLKADTLCERPLQLIVNQTAERRLMLNDTVMH